MSDHIDKIGEWALHYAAQNGDLSEVKALLKKGYPINAFDAIGKTPLHYAAEEERLEVVKCLLENGAEVNAHDERVIGDTALKSIAGSCSWEMARLLVEAGADPTIPGWMGITAIDKARDRQRGDGRRIFALLKKAARQH